jgi:Na+/H+-dicarboxylate symporter
VIYKFNRISKSWLNVVFGIVIIGISGIVALTIQLQLFPEQSEFLQFWALVALPFVFSVNLLLGMVSMKRSFERFDVIQKQYSEKASAFNRTGKKKKR